MKRWDWEGGGLVFAAMILLAIGYAAVSIIGRLLQAIGLI